MARTMRTNKKTKGKFWIAPVVQANPGSLTAYVYNTFGEAGFEKSKKTGRPIIKPSIVNQIASGKCPVCAGTPETCLCPNKITRKRAVLARTLRGF
jgi:hypothetical protein